MSSGTLGHWELRMQVPGNRPFDTSFGLLRYRTLGVTRITIPFCVFIFCYVPI